MRSTFRVALSALIGFLFLGCLIPVPVGRDWHRGDRYWRDRDRHDDRSWNDGDHDRDRDDWSRRDRDYDRRYR